MEGAGGESRLGKRSEKNNAFGPSGGGKPSIKCPQWQGISRGKIEIARIIARKVVPICQFQDAQIIPGAVVTQGQTSKLRDRQCGFASFHPPAPLRDQ